MALPKSDSTIKVSSSFNSIKSCSYKSLTSLTKLKYPVEYTL